VARPKLVVVHPERKAQRALQRSCGATMCSVEVVAEPTAAIDADSIVVIDAQLANAHRTLHTRPARAWIAVPGEGLTPADAAAVTGLLTAGWQHIVAQPMPLLAEELLATAQKLIRNETFGLEKYMAWGAEVRSYSLDDARDRDAIVGKVAADIAAIGLPERIGSLVSVIADELLANALYAAPVDDSGARFRIDEPRDRGRPLIGRDAVSLRWATDARYLAIEVRDSWGTLEPATIGARLVQTTAQTGEGGMGLPLAYACSNQFVVGVAPTKMTEVIALLDVRYKPTELARSGSFHAFTEAP
jgi:hypothetical protein